MAPQHVVEPEDFGYSLDSSGNVAFVFNGFIQDSHAEGTGVFCRDGWLVLDDLKCVLEDALRSGFLLCSVTVGVRRLPVVFS